MMAAGCAQEKERPALYEPPPEAKPLPHYEVSPRGGTPQTGPGERYNHCERIWCLVHQENFFIDHFLKDHNGWILHDDTYGDVFAARLRTEGPPFPKAHRNMLSLCGKHVHPHILKSGPIRHTGYNNRLGYSRAHFDSYGTRLEPCCINGLGSGFIHSRAGRQFNFHNLALYRSQPEWGWQKPHQSQADPAEN
jgi:hypothetical protein